MLRVHCVQLFYNLSDPGMEDHLLYEVESVRRFAGLRLTGPLPDETTILTSVTCWSGMAWARQPEELQVTHPRCPDCPGVYRVYRIPTAFN